MVFFQFSYIKMTLYGDNYSLLSMIFLHLLLVDTTMPNFKFLAYPILEMLPAGLLDPPQP